MLRRIASNHWFALIELVLVFLSGALWIFKPEIGILPIVTIALIPWVVRLMAGLAPLRNTSLNWLIAIFLITAWVGYWAAYDRETAWSKAWLIVLAVLLYAALAAQPRENLDWICAFFFCIGVGVSIYFLLTQDFEALPRKVEFVNRIGRWVMEITPEVGWTPIHPNYAAGIAAMNTPFILYPARKFVRRRNLLSTFLRVLMVAGSGIALFVILMATSGDGTFCPPYKLAHSQPDCSDIDMFHHDKYE